MLGNKTHLLFMHLDGGLMLEGMAEMNGGITGLGKGLSASCFFGLGNNLINV